MPECTHQSALRARLYHPFLLTLALALVGCAASTTAGNAGGTATATPRPSLASWQPATGSPASASTFTFAPGVPQIGYLCAGKATEHTAGGPRLFKTGDGGQTWQAVASEASPALPCHAFIDVGAPQDVLLVHALEPAANFGPPTNRELWRSQDGGATWKQLSLPDTGGGWLTLAVAGVRLVAQGAFTPAGSSGDRGCNPNAQPAPASDLYASDDGGSTWHSIGQSIEQQHLFVGAMTVMGATIFAQADTLPRNECDFTPPVSSLWRSSDGGATWARVASPACTLSFVSFTAKADGRGFFGVALATRLDPAHPGAYGVLDSSDSGATWTALPAFTLADGTPLDATSGSVPNIAATSSGAVIAEFVVRAQTGQDDHVYVLRPRDAAPAWSRYAAGAGVMGPDGTSGHWQVVHGAQGDRLWALDSVLNGGTLASLPVP